MDLKKPLESFCKVSIDGKMSLVSLYDDLPHFEFDETIDKLKNSNTKLRTFIQELKQHLKKLENENSNLKNVNVILSKNITSLYKTANSEIQRKDKIIDELRKSQVESTRTSKMFPSNNNLLLKETKCNKLSKEKQCTEQINNTVEKSKVLNQNNDENIANIVIESNLDIPKTVYYKRMCQKLAQKNKTIEFKKNMPKHIEMYNTTITDKIIQDKNEEYSNDNNILKEMIDPLICNNIKENLNSTLVISESDVTPNESDCQFTTSVIPCEKPEKGKENAFLDSFFLKQKQPIKLKKKMVITPATIGIQNIPNTILKCGEELNKSKDLDSNIKVQRKVSNSSENKVIQSSNNFTHLEVIKGHYTKLDAKMDIKPLPTTDVVYNQQSPTFENNNKIPSINIEVEQVPFRRKVVVKEINIDNVEPIKVRKSSRMTCLSSSVDYDMPVKYFKHSSMNNEKKTFSLQKNNQLECNLSTISHVINLKTLSQSVDSIRSPSKNTSVDASLSGKTCAPSISIEVEQGSIFKHSKTRKVIMHSSSENKQEIKKGRRVQLITIKDHYSQPLPSFNGAKKTEIDVSKRSVHTEKVVESSSHFFVPQVKRRRVMNFGNADL